MKKTNKTEKMKKKQQKKKDYRLSKEERILISIAIEISVRFFFSNFIYTFGGEHYIQCSGGPIGARLTMALARLIMQDWSDKFSRILMPRGTFYVSGTITNRICDG